MKRSNEKENKNNQKKERKKKAMKKWEFISINIKLHPTNKTHNGFYRTSALVGVGSF